MKAGVHLDKFDINILRQLQRNSSLSNAELSEIVCLSTSQCHRRVKRLEESGFIEKYVAVVSKRMFGLDVNAIITAKCHSLKPKDKEAFKQFALSNDLVMECWALLGEKDVLLRVVAPNMIAFSDFISNQLMAFENIASVESFVLLDNMKMSNQLPIEFMSRN